MGPSGAGKTTFMNCLMGKIKRTGGSLSINNTNMEMHKLKHVIGMPIYTQKIYFTTDNNTFM